MKAIEINAVDFSYDGQPVLDRVSLTVEEGEVVGIIGPNGSGKTTLIKLISRVLDPAHGNIMVLGHDVRGYKRKELSQKVAVVPQQAEIPFAYNVYDTVAMGRFPYQKRFGLASRPDAEVVHNSMVLTDVINYQDRYINELSGGEQQRVIIARALASEPQIMLLDEPTSFLDINHQAEIFGLIEKLNQEKRVTVLIVSHDINLAAEYCHSLVLLKDGKVRARGVVQEVVTRENISQAFDCDVTVDKNKITGAPSVYLTRRARPEAAAPRVHLVCGGGSGTGLMRKLYFLGYRLSAGVLNTGDTDAVTAQGLGIATVRDKPFAPITAEKAAQNAALIDKAEAVVVSPVYWGPGNLKNLEMVGKSAQKGKEIILVEDGKERDFTPGKKAGQLVQKLIKSESVAVVKSEAKAAAILEEKLYKKTT